MKPHPARAGRATNPGAAPRQRAPTAATDGNRELILRAAEVHQPQGDLASLARKAGRALAEFRIGGVATNIGFLQALLRHSGFAAQEVHTRFVDEHLAALLADAAAAAPARRAWPGPRSMPTIRWRC